MPESFLHLGDFRFTGEEIDGRMEMYAQAVHLDVQSCGMPILSRALSLMKPCRLELAESWPTALFFHYGLNEVLLFHSLTIIYLNHRYLGKTLFIGVSHD